MSQESPQRATIIGISGPSSSGKTTLARLLQRIFCGVNLTHGNANTHLNTFIIHEDDFYFPDDQIPTVTLPSGKQIQDWDTASAIDIDFLSKALTYVRQNGTLPPRLRSKEDQNDKADSGVPDGVVRELRDTVERSLSSLSSSEQGIVQTVAFLEGFLLFSPPVDTSTNEAQKKKNKQHILRPVHDTINLHLFLPAPYELVKARRERRSGYVTIGPAPDVSDATNTNTTNNESGDVDLEAEDDRPPQNFWTDPPGYVDDIVWPRYVEDHSWLLIADEKEGGSGNVDDHADLVRRVGDGRRIRRDVGVEVAPGCGEEGMERVLRWAVELILGYLAGEKGI
ncbi:uncharacterized protein N7446_011099 [Penicillium canescens]|uniref:Phosphoribulokinase/uridine kinase domain-containing protein n=1 Tax=Penicillium canescens TaxID=5083 RepID=A0AAD6II95_PENCN|nr:uncharacterized protein N7446_011099 [Penicillium canescens]KAJ6029550.1 hypothetical protein N7444_012537 [Penicillium canescens]KAJ6047980.1 hypothetical protein N7460_004127 [Penicillium canescens]KAJ6048416.1 hypothetical protein N7446_011099 [Penicillium canescens]